MFTLILLSLLIAFAAMLAVAYPVLARTRGGEPAASAEETIGELLAQRDNVFQALRELRFDHEVGKITDEDFGAFEGNLKHAAAESLRTLDEWEKKADVALQPEIEQAVAARAASMSSEGVLCPNCGRLAGFEDKFCGSCGAEIIAPRPAAAPAQPLCANCGRPYSAGDRFCAGCGQAIVG